MNIDLSGRAALITGGSKGLGFAMARAFVDAGANVAIVARDEAALKSAGDTLADGVARKVVTIKCDVSRAHEIEHAYAAAMEAFGAIDIVVNNAGQASSGALHTTTDEAWQADIDLKLFAAIRLTRLAWAGMAERQWGRVINVLSTGAKTPSAFSAPSSVTRAAGLALTKVMAGEGAKHNILVNALLVGAIESDQTARIHQTRAADRSYEEFLGELGRRVPLGRVGKAEEFAAIARFLASDSASYITGAAINVDGGASPVV